MPQDEPDPRAWLDAALGSGSRQTTQPLPAYQLSVTNRTARDVVTSMLPMIDTEPPYQRGSVWTPDQRIALVKSWIMGVPVPPIVLNDRANSGWTATMGSSVYADKAAVWAVVDGKQRIETAFAWFRANLAVPASWFPGDHVNTTVDTADGPYVTYTGLQPAIQGALAFNAMLPVVEASLPSLQAEAELYLLVNGGGTGQSEEDMARAARIAGMTS